MRERAEVREREKVRERAKVREREEVRERKGQKGSQNKAFIHIMRTEINET